MLRNRRNEILVSLALIAPFDLGNRPLEPEPTHLIAEAERLAFADRARYLGDPDFVAVPVKGLLDPAYLNQRRALIAPWPVTPRARRRNPRAWGGSSSLPLQA